MRFHPGAVNCLLAGAAIRLVLIVFGCIQDKYFQVRYTDIDYDVFSDAAEYMLHGQSPFERSTYRYSPLLAAILVPNFWFTEWGKVLFASADITAGALVAELVGFQAGEKAQQWSVALWLFNPYTATISTRGSCDVLVVLMLLAVLKWLRDGHWALAAALYGAAVHFRIYPAIYAPSIMLFVWSHALDRMQQVPPKKTHPRRPSLFASLQVLLYCGSIGAATFAALTTVFTWLYGQTYLNEALLYHLTRKDIRHNFSVYYYHLYLSSDVGAAGATSSPTSPFSDVGFLAFAPQLLLVLLFSVLYFRHLPMCWLLVTHAFVAFNKVCTAQYFMWYFCLLPLVTSSFRWPPRRRLLLAAAVWLLTQLQWLYWAYGLEFQGHPTFVYIWTAGIMFLAANSFLMIEFMVSFQPKGAFAAPQLVGERPKKHV